MNISFNRKITVIIGFLILINAILILGSPLLPFIDLPNHLAEATIYKYKNSTDVLLGQYYEAVPWFYPNTFHTVFCSLFPSVEAGNKVFYILYIMSLLLSMNSVIKQLGGNQLYGLLTVLFLYNYNVTYGFTGFSIAIPTTILLFFIILKDVAKEQLLNKAIAALLLILLYLMHAQMALFGLVLYGLIMIYRYRKDFKTLFLNVTFVSLPVLIMVGVWWVNRAAIQEETSTITCLLQYYKQNYLPDFLLRFRLFVFDNFSLRAGAAGLVIASILFSLIFLPLLYYKVWKNNRKEEVSKEPLVYAIVFLFISAGCYFFLPSKLPGQAPLYERFSTIVALATIIVGSLLLKKVHTSALRYFVIGSVIIYSGLWFEYFYTFNKVNKNFTPAFFSEVQKNAKLGGLIYDLRWRGRFPFIHFPNYYLVWNKGIAASKIIDYRFGVVQRGVKGAEIPFYNEWIGQNHRPVKSYDTTLHYLLVRGNAPAQPDSNLLNFQLVKKEGLWQLYRNRQLPL